jgi:hypothetical protein
MFDEIGWVESSLDGLQPGECCAICSGNFIWSLDELPISLLSSYKEVDLHMVKDHLPSLDGSLP